MRDVRCHSCATCLQRALRAVAVAGIAFSLTQPAWAIDLWQAYQSALEQDSTLRAARAGADSARERLPQARAQLLPNLSFSAMRTRNDLTRTQPVSSGQLPEQTYSSENQTLTLRQALFRKPLFAALEQASHAVNDAEATLDLEFQNLGVRLVSAYVEALLAADQLDLILTQQAFTKVQLDAARKAIDAGSGTRTDIDAAQAGLDLNLAKELEARQNLDYTHRQLERMIKRSPGPLLRLDPGKLAQRLARPGTLDDWLALAEAGSPELRSLKARSEVARLEVEKMSANHYPTLDAVAQVAKSVSENVISASTAYTNNTVGLQLSIPLYAGGYIDSTVRQTIAERTKAAETLEATRRDLELRVHREYRGVTEGLLKVEALEQAVRSGQQLVKSSRRSFAAGFRSVVDILNAEQQLEAARRDLAEARYLVVLSWVRLNALVGADQESVIRDINAIFAGQEPATVAGELPAGLTGSEDSAAPRSPSFSVEFGMFALRS